jgi:hypothetical protein
LPNLCINTGIVCKEFPILYKELGFRHAFSPRTPV